VDPGGDLQQPAAQRRGLGTGNRALDPGGLGQGIRSAAVRASCPDQAGLNANCGDGSRAEPVFLAQRIRSSAEHCAGQIPRRHVKRVRHDTGKRDRQERSREHVVNSEKCHEFLPVSHVVRVRLTVPSTRIMPWAKGEAHVAIHRSSARHHRHRGANPP
jgi:hypothetical protein